MDGARETFTIRDAVCVQLLSEVLKLSGVARIRAFGSSMLPAVLPGDILIVQREMGKSVVPGEIVVFTRESRLFAHRVIGETSRGGTVCLLTSGDSLDQPDSPVFPHELLGQVAFVIRGRRRLYPRATFLTRVTSTLLVNSEFLTRCFLWLLGRSGHSSTRANAVLN